MKLPQPPLQRARPEALRRAGRRRPPVAGRLTRLTPVSRSRRCVLRSSWAWRRPRCVAAAPLRRQERRGGDQTWELEGLRTAFCVQLLLDPGLGAPAGAADGVSRRSRLRGHRSPRLPPRRRRGPAGVRRLEPVAPLLHDRRHDPHQGLSRWPTGAASIRSCSRSGPCSPRARPAAPQDVALELFTNSDRLIRSARLAGQEVREARLTVGKVPGGGRERRPELRRPLSGEAGEDDDHLGWPPGRRQRAASGARGTIAGRPPASRPAWRPERSRSTPRIRRRWWARSRWMARMRSRRRSGVADAVRGPRIAAGEGRLTLRPLSLRRSHHERRNACRSVHVEDVHNRSI